MNKIKILFINETWVYFNTYRHFPSSTWNIWIILISFVVHQNKFETTYFFLSELYKVQKREKDYFGTLLNKLMDATEKYMKQQKCETKRKL